LFPQAFLDKMTLYRCGARSSRLARRRFLAPLLPTDPDAEQFDGIVDNTDIGALLLDAVSGD
jgi:hypothetical protein